MFWDSASWAARAACPEWQQWNARVPPQHEDVVPSPSRTALRRRRTGQRVGPQHCPAPAPETCTEVCLPLLRYCFQLCSPRTVGSIWLDQNRGFLAARPTPFLETARPAEARSVAGNTGGRRGFFRGELQRLPCCRSRCRQYSPADRCCQDFFPVSRPPGCRPCSTVWDTGVNIARDEHGIRVGVACAQQREDVWTGAVSPSRLHRRLRLAHAVASAAPAASSWSANRKLRDWRGTLGGV